MRTEGLRVLLVRVTYAVALAAAVAWAFLILSAAATGGTLGYDFRAYDLAVDRMVAGESMYDLGASSMGAFGLFFYPPPFALLILPFALLETDLAVTAWTAVLVVATLVAIAVMPVSRRTRLVLLLLAALSWPVVYAIKLGQVGPMLLLLLAFGWRGLDRPWHLGLATGLGTVVKLQPAVVIGWAVAPGRRRAAAIAVATFGVFGVIATARAGVGAWTDWLAVLRNVSSPVLAENDVGFGRLAYLAGASLPLATAIHYANVAAVILVAFLAVWRASPIASYLAVVVASQFVSPVLWDHYAVLLLLPVAWLVDRGQWWAALVPLATSTFLIGITPGIAYPVLFWVVLLSVTVEGMRRRRPAISPSMDARAEPSPAA